MEIEQPFSPPAAREGRSAGLAAAARAAVEARFLVAINRPRDWDVVRQRLLKTCARPRFAEAAVYDVPVGGGNRARGFSIRFAEVAAQCMGNLDVQQDLIDDSPETRTVRLSVTDLESNLTYHRDLEIAKRVERKTLKEGEQPLGQRITSDGRRNFFVRATEEEMRAIEQAEASRGFRGVILRMLPVDIKEEAGELLDAVKEAAIKEAPDKARRRLIDSFNRLGISVTALKRYVGHEMERVEPAELLHLQELWAAIDSGETSWHSAARARDDERSAKPKEAAPAAEEEAEEATPPTEASAEATPAAAAKTAPAEEATPPNKASAEATLLNPMPDPAESFAKPINIDRADLIARIGSALRQDPGRLTPIITNALTGFRAARLADLTDAQLRELSGGIN